MATRAQRLHGIVATAVSLVFLSFVCKQISLITSDLGRHLKNGSLLLNGDSSVRSFNHYSYTAPDFPVLNHHWAFGVLVYWLHHAFGFVGLSIFHALILAASFGIMVYVANRSFGFYPAFAAAFIAIPLVTCRIEVRPEEVSYLFCSVFVALLWAWSTEKIRVKSFLLLALPLLEAIWVNVHIYFFIGIAIEFAFLLENLIARRDLQRRNILIGLIVLSVFFTLLNPAGFNELLFPVMIFKNYGYPVSENLSIFEMGKFIGPLLFPLAILFVLTLAMAFQWKNFKKSSFPLALLIVAGGASMMAVVAVRNLALAGLLLIPISAAGIHFLVQKKNLFSIRVLGISLGIGYLVWFLGLIAPPQISTRLGFGLASGDSAAADFFLSNHLKGPIFNNFDVGGYLIYYLYPQERVFFDNRPEAYPEEFVRSDYIQPQLDEEAWSRVVAKYKINTLIFTWSDATDWGHRFVHARISDPHWVPVFLDSKVIIFLKDSAENSSLIAKYGLSRDFAVPHDSSL